MASSTSEIHSSVAHTNTAMAEIAETSERTFKNFDIVSSPPKNHRYGNCHPRAPSNVRALANRISKEWRILESGLPETIFVRAYASRTDLMTAAIVGPQGTPYSDGIFFFDIILPSDYPSVPPEFYFRSHGLTLNPNLYPNGAVCLSLLNTWRGRAEERWSGPRSTILQVLVSIQGLVLNEEPYFNEPYAMRLFSNRLSAGYSDYVYLMTCKSMKFAMRNPPEEFGDLVSDHFRRRSDAILTKCRDNLGIDDAMIEIVHELAEMMKRIGADCDEIVDEVEREWKKIQEIRARERMNLWKGSWFKVMKFCSFICEWWVSH